MRRFTYIGTYGVAIQENKILLVTKKKGPYTGLYDLPGGGLEFGEAIIDALKREFFEEVCLTIDEIEWMGNFTYLGKTKEHEADVEFYHIGLIYRISHFRPAANECPEEEFAWYDLSTLNIEQLSPFTRKVLKYI